LAEKIGAIATSRHVSADRFQKSKDPARMTFGG
jgi:hypothetical protein